VDRKIKGGGRPTYPSLSSFQAERKTGTYYIMSTYILNRLSIIHLPQNWQYIDKIDSNLLHWYISILKHNIYSKMCWLINMAILMQYEEESYLVKNIQYCPR